MATRELSSNLRNLKFMQRAAQREEATKKEVKPDVTFSSPDIASRKCVVIMEGDPHPGTVKGRMSFLSFNPSIDKLNEEAINVREPAASASSSGVQSGGVSLRENESSMDEAGCTNMDEQNYETNGDHKRKQSEVVSESQFPNKSPKSHQDEQHSQQNRSKGSFRKPKDEKLDLNVLRRSNSKR